MQMPGRLRLGVNIDHVATIRQARYATMPESKNAEPDPVAIASVCERAGAAGITAHLRTDRRHIHRCGGRTRHLSCLTREQCYRRDQGDHRGNEQYLPEACVEPGKHVRREAVIAPRQRVDPKCGGAEDQHCRRELDEAAGVEHLIHR